MGRSKRTTKTLTREKLPALVPSPIRPTGEMAKTCEIVALGREDVCLEFKKLLTSYDQLQLDKAREALADVVATDALSRVPDVMPPPGGKRAVQSCGYRHPTTTWPHNREVQDRRLAQGGRRRNG